MDDKLFDCGMMDTSNEPQSITPSLIPSQPSPQRLQPKIVKVKVIPEEKILEQYKMVEEERKKEEKDKPKIIDMSTILLRDTI
ncbi:hypothetical protein ACWV26_16570 [Rummeliibacillus sp. JY-2-4R]